MESTFLRIYVIPADVDLSRVSEYFENIKTFSTSTEIKVNKVIAGGYAILYRADVFKNMDMEVLGNNIIKLFMKNVPDSMINISIEYPYKVIDDNGDIKDDIDISTVNNILKLDSKFDKLAENGNFQNNKFYYSRSSNLSDVIKFVIESYNEVDYDDEDDYEDEYLNDYFENIGMYPDAEDDDDDDDVIDDDEFDNYDEDSASILEAYMRNRDDGYTNTSKVKKRRKSYPESKILDTARNPKRAYNRHGVIICNDKSARKRDEKILKEFLKDFFPGNAEWKKEFRHDVLKRWMKMYFIAKKDLKELERTHRKAKNAKRNNIKTEKTLDFTRRLFNVPIDRWNDPSR